MLSSAPRWRGVLSYEAKAGSPRALSRRSSRCSRDAPGAAFLVVASRRLTCRDVRRAPVDPQAAARALPSSGTVHSPRALAGFTAKDSYMKSNRMPPVQSKHVVPVHAVARMLGWSTARVRSIDDILRPIRLADGSHVYDVMRVLFFVRVFDSAP